MSLPATGLRCVQAMKPVHINIRMSPVGIAKPPLPAPLSPREREILGLLAEGLTGREIARRLYLSPETVRTHIRNATTRLGAKTRVQAVAIMLGHVARTHPVSLADAA
jgi:DNA-binding CsgD family transcriptional regulator